MTSSATSTKFAAHELKGPDGRSLWIDGNAKITAGNGSFHSPAPNAFSVVEVADCPFRTPTCEKACYVHGLKKLAPIVHGLYEHNSRTIREILSDPPHAGIAWAEDFADWIDQNCLDFRWHVSGDIFSIKYAEWIQGVCYGSPRTRHWIYTRSFPFLDPLLAVSSTLNGGNLVINLSCDADNYWLAKRYADEHGLRLCYLTSDGTFPDDLPDGSVIFPDYALRGRDLDKPTDAPWWQSLLPRERKMVCPVDFFGKSESIRCGPCKKCLV